MQPERKQSIWNVYRLPHIQIVHWTYMRILSGVFTVSTIAGLAVAGTFEDAFSARVGLVLSFQLILPLFALQATALVDIVHAWLTIISALLFAVANTLLAAYLGIQLAGDVEGDSDVMRQDVGTFWSFVFVLFNAVTAIGLAWVAILIVHSLRKQQRLRLQGHPLSEREESHMATDIPWTDGRWQSADQEFRIASEDENGQVADDRKQW